MVEYSKVYDIASIIRRCTNNFKREQFFKYKDELDEVGLGQI